MSFPLAGNPSEERFWTSQNDIQKNENGKTGATVPATIYLANS